MLYYNYGVHPYCQMCLRQLDEDFWKYQKYATCLHACVLSGGNFYNCDPKCKLETGYQPYGNYMSERDQCTYGCPQKFTQGGYCGKSCTLIAGHSGPHICPDGHQW